MTPKERYDRRYAGSNPRAAARRAARIERRRQDAAARQVRNVSTAEVRRCWGEATGVLPSAKEFAARKPTGTRFTSLLEASR